MLFTRWLDRVQKSVLGQSARRSMSRCGKERRSLIRSRSQSRLESVTESLEDRALLATISASLVGGALSISDTDATGKKRELDYARELYLANARST